MARRSGTAGRRVVAFFAAVQGVGWFVVADFDGEGGGILCGRRTEGWR